MTAKGLVGQCLCSETLNEYVAHMLLAVMACQDGGLCASVDRCLLEIGYRVV